MSTTTGLADILDIAVIPLTDASSTSAGATFVGGVKDVQVELAANPTVVTFDLIPTYSAGLDAPINYRVMWRIGVMGRTYTYDFAMPDADLTWQALTATLGSIIDGTTYLQQADLGVPGRVARLNSDGQVIDAAGIPVAGSADITEVQNIISAETVARQAADAQLRSGLEGELTAQVTSTLSTAQAYTDNKLVGVNSDIANERGSRINADNDLQTQITTNLSALTGQITTVSTTAASNTAALATKADLDNTGHVPVAQIPDAILTNAYPVADQASMLAMSTSIVHKGDLAVRPDGVWLLTTDDPSQLANWISLSAVSSVNGKRGVVTLSAADVNAIPVGGAINTNQVTGLASNLSAKANQTDLVALQTTVTGIQNDPTLVHTTNGVIPATLLDTNMVYLNTYGQLVHKDGTVIPITGGGGAVFSVNQKTGLVVLTAADVGAIPTGGSISMTQVTGLNPALANKADLDTNGLVPVAEVPSLAITKITGLSTALGNKADLSAGLVPLSQVPVLPLTQTTGLSALVSGNQLTSSSNAINRIASLESQVTSGGGGGGGGSGTASTTVPFYTSSNTTTPVIDFTSVNLHSPWGIDSDGTITGTAGTWYYLFTGVRSTDVAYPYISQNGHLGLHKWNESGPADPVYALASDLSALTTTVNAKAAQTDLTALTNTVAGKANNTDLSALSTTVGTKANTADLNNLATSVAGKANTSDLNTTNTVVASKANQTDLTALTTTVGTKANQTDMTTAQTNISALQTALPTKADLSGGKVLLSEIPTGIPITNIQNLASTLAATATLTNGVLTSSQIPQVPQANVTGLGTTLGAKADLVNGVVPMSQIPLGALPNIQVVANRAAMLALTTAQVQYGDMCLITGTTDQGTYVLTGNDASQFANWTEIATPQAPVTRSMVLPARWCCKLPMWVHWLPTPPSRSLRSPGSPLSWVLLPPPRR